MKEKKTTSIKRKDGMRGVARGLYFELPEGIDVEFFEWIDWVAVQCLAHFADIFAGGEA
jgi:hypothetical protein